MKYHESLAQITPKFRRTGGSGETWREAVKIGVDLLVAAGVKWNRATTGAILDGVAAAAILHDRSGISHAARAAGRERPKPRLCAGVR